MDKDFDIFWGEYLLERGNYRDDAWENILCSMVSAQPEDKRVKIIEALVDKCIERQSKYSHWAFETLDRFADAQQVERLQNFTETCIVNDVAYQSYSDIIVFLIKKDFESIRQTAGQIIATQDFKNPWKYILKNVYFKDKDIFIAGLQRYLESHHELGFDLGVFIKYTPDARQLAMERLVDFKRFDTELERY